MTSPANSRIRLLADLPKLIGDVGELRWREWGRPPEPAELSWWVEVTMRESGSDALPATFVALDPAGQVAGAVGIGEFDPAERRDRSPWVLGMVVRPDLRGKGVGRELLDALGGWAAGHGHAQIWVATGNSAVGFYQRCGWRITEQFDRPGDELVTVLTRNVS